MKKSKRMLAWMVSLALLLGQSAWAQESSPSEADPITPMPEATSTPEIPSMPESTPTPTPEAMPAPEVTPEPTAAPAPKGESWMNSEDGAIVDGDLQEILTRLQESGAEATVYLLTDEVIRVTGIERTLLEKQVTLEPDPTVFRNGLMVYSVQIREEETVDLPALLISVEAMPKETAIPEETPSAALEGTPTAAPEETPTPAPSPTEAPVPPMQLSVEVADYRPGEWSCMAPVFTLSGIPEGSREYVYGVFVCDERLILLSQGNSTYSPEQEGAVSLRFAILDMMGDVAALSAQYDMLLDFTPPDGPYPIRLGYTDTVIEIGVSDALSGIAEVSLDGGSTWFVPDGTIYMRGEKGEEIRAEQLRARDAAGNVSMCYEPFTFGPEPAISSGSGTGQKTIKHVKETMDYSTANYNALELAFSPEPSTELWAGDTQLALSLRSAGEEELLAFTAELTAWASQEDEPQEEPNALVLHALNAQAAGASPPEGQESGSAEPGVHVWSFTGDVYKLLYNSGIDYLVLQSGEYIAAIPTAGFTGGTAYAKLKASGVSTRRFAYTLCQDESLRETVLSVTVEGETYLLGEERNQPMYRYDVLVGTQEMMEKPYATYLPGNEDGTANGGQP